MHDKCGPVQLEPRSRTQLIYKPLANSSHVFTERDSSVATVDLLLIGSFSSTLCKEHLVPLICFLFIQRKNGTSLARALPAISQYVFVFIYFCIYLFICLFIYLLDSVTVRQALNPGPSPAPPHHVTFSEDPDFDKTVSAPLKKRLGAREPLMSRKN